MSQKLNLFFLKDKKSKKARRKTTPKKLIKKVAEKVKILGNLEKT